jgi:LEA14-like dessication related protein
MKFEVEDLKSQIQNNQDPSEEFLKLINLVFEHNFSIYVHDSSETKLREINIGNGTKTDFHILKVSNSSYL